eukprot:jgi/Bigna1/86090/estExt_fgenesh1_pg.C_80063
MRVASVSSVENVEMKLRQESKDVEPQGSKIEGIDLTWHEISVKTPAPASGKGTARIILNKASGTIKKGQMSAIMGPSGSGKTTLMSTLAGRQDLEWSGYTAANGSKIDPVQFRKNIAFVLQEESLFATQTPREALKFSAQLRLTGELTEQEQNERLLKT